MSFFKLTIEKWSFRMVFKRKIGPKYKKKYLAELGRKGGSITTPQRPLAIKRRVENKLLSQNILFKYSLILSGNLEIKKLHSINLCSHCWKNIPTYAVSIYMIP